MIQSRTFDPPMISAALDRLIEVWGDVPDMTLADVLRHAKDESDEAALRMIFTLSKELTRTGDPASAVARVHYKRLDAHRHSITIDFHKGGSFTRN
jgi:hypothetical protein